MEDESKNYTKDITIGVSNIETIDYALYDWINEKMDLFTTTNKGWKKVPIVWVGSERAFQTKENRERRDKSGTIDYPLITIERNNIVKNPSNKGTAYANIPAINDEKGGSITIARRINQDKTSNFANANTKRKLGVINFPRKNKKVVYETISIPMPVYIDVTYNIGIKTLFQQQMNEILQPFLTKTGGINYFIIKRENHRYEAFIQQDFPSTANIANMGLEERKFEIKFSIKVLGYLIGLGANQEQPKIAIRENAVEIHIPRERIIVGDIPTTKGSDGFYGTTSLEGEGLKK